MLKEKSKADLEKIKNFQKEVGAITTELQKSKQNKVNSKPKTLRFPVQGIKMTDIRYNPKG